MQLLTINNISSFRCKAYVRFIHGEQRPGLGAEVDAVKASERDVVPLQTHGAAHHCAMLWQLARQRRQLTTTHALQYMLPVPVMTDL